MQSSTSYLYSGNIRKLIIQWKKISFFHRRDEIGVITIWERMGLVAQRQKRRSRYVVNAVSVLKIISFMSLKFALALSKIDISFSGTICDCLFFFLSSRFFYIFQQTNEINILSVRLIRERRLNSMKWITQECYHIINLIDWCIYLPREPIQELISAWKRTLLHELVRLATHFFRVAL